MGSGVGVTGGVGLRVHHVGIDGFEGLHVGGAGGIDAVGLLERLHSFLGAAVVAAGDGAAVVAQLLEAALEPVHGLALLALLELFKGLGRHCAGYINRRGRGFGGW